MRQNETVRASGVRLIGNSPELIRAFKALCQSAAMNKDFEEKKMLFNKAKRAEAARIEEKAKMDDESYNIGDILAGYTTLKTDRRFFRDDFTALTTKIIDGLFNAHNLVRCGHPLSVDQSSHPDSLEKQEVRGDKPFKELFFEGEIELSPPLYGSEVECRSDNARLCFRATMKISQKEGKNNSGKGGEGGSEDGVGH